MLLERYPELHFRILWEGTPASLTPPSLLVAEDGIEAEIQRFQSSLSLSSIEILYLYGLGIGQHFPFLRSWLEENPRRKLVYLEDDLAAIDACCKQGNEELFAHPQVFIRFVPHPRAWSGMLKQCAIDFPAKCVELKAIESYAKNKKKRPAAKIKLKLLRLSGIFCTYFEEAIHVHQIHNNLLGNLNQLEQVFDTAGLRDVFKGVPAVICGAGPSLKTHIEGLKALEDRALILAGGSAITALGNLGIFPHIGLAIDPNEEEVHRFEASVVQEVPFLFGLRLYPQVFETLNAPLGYLHTRTGGSAEGWLQDHFGIERDPMHDALGMEALSITTLGLTLAYIMGCDPITIVGVDLAYTGLTRYAPGVGAQQIIDPKSISIPKEQLETMLKRKDAKGDTIYTLVKWVMEANVFSRFAKKQSQRKFFRIGQEGLPIKHFPSLSLEEIAARYALDQHDFLGRLHQVVHASPIRGITQEKISSIRKDLRLSLERMETICLAVLSEIDEARKQEHLMLFPTGKMMGLQMNFEEEEAYSCFFETVAAVFDLKHRHEKTRPELMIELETDKWKHLLDAIRFYLKRKND
jgi:hypothetical protein